MKAPEAPNAAKVAKKAPSPPKYFDGAGNTWTGNGKRPRRFVRHRGRQTPTDPEIAALAA